MKSGESGRTDGGLPWQSICQLKTIVIWTIPIFTITKFILGSTNIWPKIIIAVFPLTRPTLFQHTTLLFWSLKMQYKKSKSPTLNKITHKFIKFQSRSSFFFFFFFFFFFLEKTIKKRVSPTYRPFSFSMLIETVPVLYAFIISVIP